MSPEFYNQLAAQGASIFTNSAALDSMGVSPLFHLESKTMNKLSAIANARPFVQSAKGGPAYIINKDGKIYSYDDNNEGGVALASVEANTTRTAYSYLGEWVVALSFVITIVAFTRQLSVKKPNI
jgi:apolipoprotein N-acyltransferase